MNQENGHAPQPAPEDPGGQLGGGPNFRRTSPANFQDGSKSLVLIRRALERGWDIPAATLKSLPKVLSAIVNDKNQSARNVANASKCLIAMVSVNEHIIANELKIIEVVELKAELENLRAELDGTAPCA